MKNNIIIIFSLIFQSSFAQTSVNQEEPGKNLSALISYNFLGGSTNLSNLTPEVFLGWNKYIIGKRADLFSGQIKVGPYASSQINIKDSTAYLPALMMPGNAGIILDNYWVIDNQNTNNNHRLLLSPINLGLKVMSNFSDTTKTLLQHNIRTKIGYQYNDLFSLTIQYTWGWHNLTSMSEVNFEKTLKKKITDVQYLTISLQTKITKEENEQPVYLFAVWRGFLNKKDFNNLENSKILTFGIRKSLDITGGISAFR